MKPNDLDLIRKLLDAGLPVEPEAVKHLVEEIEYLRCEAVYQREAARLYSSQAHADAQARALLEEEIKVLRGTK